MLSYGGLLKQKHKILNLDDAEEGNLIQTSDNEKTRRRPMILPIIMEV